MEPWSWWLMSSCSFNINLNKKIDSHLLYFLWNRWGWFFKSKFIGSHFRVWVIYVTEALSLIGKSRIWFYYCFGQCVLKVVTINNNKLEKGPWIILLVLLLLDINNDPKIRSFPIMYGNSLMGSQFWEQP